MPKSKSATPVNATRFALLRDGAEVARAATFKEAADTADALNLQAHQNCLIQDTAARRGESCIWHLVEGKDGSRLWAVRGKLIRPRGAAAPTVQSVA